MLIFITGYMAAGKTTIGRALADRIGYRFLDMDEMIEISTGFTIPGYFARFGESAFRTKEHELLLSHLNDQDTVIATGGGTPCFHDNMKLMNQHGVTVFIGVSPETILGRMEEKVMLRPLLASVPREQLPGFINQHLAARMEFYYQAVIHVDGEKFDLEALIRRLFADRPGPYPV